MVNTLIREGGVNSQLFWTMRKRIITKDSDATYDTKDENGNKIEDPEEAKEHIANYYENLYQARQGDPNYDNWTEIIKNKVNDISFGSNHIHLKIFCYLIGAHFSIKD